ncbi:MAG: DALR anticodon-binding domain-containing protein, partial [Bacteroidota bacterium]
DADDLLDEMIETAREMSKELGKLEGYSEEEKENIYRIIGLGALKYFILKVDPKKNMTFNPKESIDFNGNTGPFIQYTYARIQSVLRKAADNGIHFDNIDFVGASYNQKEIDLVKLVLSFKSVVQQSAEEFNPALIANYVYELAKEYNQFYHDYTILKEKDNKLKAFRLAISEKVGKIIADGMELLGIEVPERM